jgi:hypothetical protein
MSIATEAPRWLGATVVRFCVGAAVGALGGLLAVFALISIFMIGSFFADFLFQVKFDPPEAIFPGGDVYSPSLYRLGGLIGCVIGACVGLFGPRAKRDPIP